MGKRNISNKKTRPVNKAKAKIRGVIAAARNATTYNERGSHSYDFAQRKSFFSQSLSFNLLIARQELPFTDYDKFLDWSDSQQENLLPKQFKEVKPTLASLSFARETKEISLTSEAFWLAHRLRRERNSISTFLILKAQIENAFWTGNVTQIYSLFQELAVTLGQSVWLVEARLSVEQAFKGLESQKKVLEDIRKDAGRGFIQFLSHRMSMRNEMAVTTQRFSASLSSYISSRPNIKPDTARYLKYKLCHDIPTCEADICAILRFQQNHSIIDCYEGLVDIVQELVGLKGAEKTFGLLYNVLKSIEVHDERVAKLEMLAEQLPVGQANLCNLKASELLLQGEIKPAVKVALQNFRKTPKKDIFQLYIAAQASSFLRNREPNSKIKERKPLYDYTRLLADIIAKNANSARSYDHLEKRLRNFQIFSSCKAFLDIVRREHNPLQFKEDKSRIYFSLNNGLFCPFDINSESYIEGIMYDESSGTVSATKQFMATRSSKAKGESILPEIVTAIARISGAYLAGDNLLLIRTIDEYRSSSEYQSIGHRFKIIEADALIALGETRQAIRIFGETVAKNRSYVDQLPFEALVNKSTQWADLRQFGDEISVPILLNQVYTSSPNTKLATLRRTSVDYFLRKTEIHQPSKLVDHIDRFGADNLIYFMKNLCAPSILDMCKCLAGTKAVDEERLSVLGALLLLDPKNSDTYQSEILTLSGSLRIREGLKVVDGSRIHVDLEGILRWVNAELQESLSRYKNLVEAGIGIAEDLDDVIKDFMAQSNPKAYMDTPKSEADDIVVSMLWQLRDRFLFDKPHGLNSYLSKRVRHNSIAGYLRGALEKEALITPMSGGVYRENDHWNLILKDRGYSTQEIALTLNLLKDFGAKFDALTTYLKEAVLHIKRPEYPHGLIDLTLQPALFYMARSALQSSNYNLYSWFEVCITMFWLRLEPSLFRVREALRKEYKAKAVALFDNLRADLVKNLGRDKQCHDLNTSINNASIELQNLCDRAADWFNKRQGELSKYAYSLNEILDISIQSALTRHRSCNIQISKTVVSSLELRADALVTIADILLVVIGNISDHSGCREEAQLSITARLDEELNIINLTFESTCSPDACNERSLELLDITRSDINSGAYLDKMALDRRSGLSKVASIVKPEAGGRIEFGFKSPTLFYLDVDLTLTIESVKFNTYDSEMACEDTPC